MTYIVVGFLGLLEVIVSWFPDSIEFNIPAINIIATNAGEWIDIPSIMVVVSLMISIHAAMGIAFLVNWIIKRVRGG
ncbi:hypothetical protein [Mesotoga prima]|uniref:hypothetical protein n=1 Tax=Mesotoga prima TaxID=1184387 RepID=UPI002FDA2519